MSSRIVVSGRVPPRAPSPVKNKILLLVGAGNVPKTVLHQINPHAHTIAAVDGGANTLLRHNIVPHVLLGDGDSIRPVVRAAFKQQGVTEAFESEQETTDLEKALRYADSHAKNSAIVGLGFAGNRFDHTLAALHVLRRFGHRDITLHMGKDAVRLLPKKHNVINLPVGTRVSFFPLADVTGFSSTGLKYPWNNHQFGIGKALGVSNKITKSPAEVSANIANSILLITPWKNGVQAVQTAVL